MKAPKKRTLVSSDWAAKNILRDKANYDMRKIFNHSFKTGDKNQIDVKERRHSKFETGKFNKVDLLVESEQGKLIVVEIQNNREIHYLERVLYAHPN